MSVYFGGGTPSLASPGWLKQVLDEVVNQFGREYLTEVTLEANPIDCTESKLNAWKDLGINRLSVGVQSFHEKELTLLGRDHSMGDGEEALARVSVAGLRSFSADAILGAPSKDRGLETLADLSRRNIPHISAYELTIEPNTPLKKAVEERTFLPLSEDARFGVFEETHKVLTEAGYEHYEISSFAKPGHRAVHNSLYWSGGEYLGVGNGAASFLRFEDGRAERFLNPRSVRRYMESPPKEREKESLSTTEVETDLLWLGLRTSQGVDRKLFANRSAERDWLLGQGLAKEDGNRVIPTFRGFVFANQVAQAIVNGAPQK